MMHSLLALSFGSDSTLVTGMPELPLPSYQQLLPLQQIWGIHGNRWAIVRGKDMDVKMFIENMGEICAARRTACRKCSEFASGVCVAGSL